MDLYQIFISHNRVWTFCEIMCFSVLFIIAAIISCALLRYKKIVLSQAVAGLVLLLFLGIVFGSTVFTRTPKPYFDYELELFWSWKAVYNGNQELMKENLLNMILLFPVGILLPFLHRHKLSWCRGLIAGILISLFIETNQLIFRRGLFEWDDMIHNGIGCMSGCIISSWFMKQDKKGRKS